MAALFPRIRSCSKYAPKILTIIFSHLTLASWQIFFSSSILKQGEGDHIFALTDLHVGGTRTLNGTADGTEL